ncbi:hypothetical protein BASA81_000684 [Batrachochytrium salamandrivorans]|nr:hypothetical protein BASA81_000684 [Batrachochytrium salamandrivorans]
MPHSSIIIHSSGGGGASSPEPGVLLNLPYHITVEKKRKALDVLSWGSFPFALDEHGNLIPNGFSVRTYYKGKWFVASTRVATQPPVPPTILPAVPPTQQEQYQFVCETSEPHCVGDWNPTPSGALQSVVDKLGSSIKCARGSNGALQIGVTYYNVQLAIRKVFCLQSTHLVQAVAVGVAANTNSGKNSSCTECEEAGDSLAAVQHDVALLPAVATGAATTPATTAAVAATTLHRESSTSSVGTSHSRQGEVEEDYQARKRVLVMDELASPPLDWGEAYLLDSGEEDWFPAMGF